MSGPDTSTAGLRVAIVGAGPAGLYAAVDLLNRNATAAVDMFERLPVPGGLARYGVAPDHAERRQVIEHYGRLALASGRFRLHGNVEIGRHISHAELLQHCHAVIYASGAITDRRLEIPGEDLPGSHSATEFVAWYNGHPDFVDRQFNLDTERAVVIGNGNVALDVARMLLMSAERLRGTDVAEHALASLSRNQIREVVVVGRRGPLQASFTVPELLELAQLDDIDVAIECPREASWTDDRSAHPLRLTLLRELANRQPRGRAKRLVLRFLASPIELRGTEQVESLRLARNRLVAGPDGKVRSEPTDEIEVLPTGLVLRSVGYRATPPPAIPFDDAAGVVPNRGGRVIEFPGDTPLAGVYVAGWLKRGPSGFIGTNKLCSRQTVSSLLEDAAAGRLALPTVSPTELDALLVARQPARIDYAGWKRIDRTECRLGIEQGRTRRRLSHWQDLLGAAV